MIESAIRLALSSVAQFGVDPGRLARSIGGIPAYVRDLMRYAALAGGTPEAVPIGALYPIMNERGTQAGTASGHYFHQDLWAARKIFKANPRRHVDIGSSVAGFVAHLLVFREVELVDIRALQSDVSGLTFVRSDATNLKEFADNSLESISTLHAGEHFGLGRYGDPVDPTAHHKFMRSLARVLRPDGRLYFSIPCGREKLYFNAHRVLSPDTVLRAFGDLKLVSFSCVKDDERLYADCSPRDVAGETYGCGLFEFTKVKSA